MNYLSWIILALFTYSLIGPLVRVSTHDIPYEVVMFVSTGVMLVITLGVMGYNGRIAPAYFLDPATVFVYIAGIFLAIGAIAYFRALSMGPVSVVVPIFGMFIVLSSVIGIIFLGEEVSIRKTVGIGVAILAIHLTSVSPQETEGEGPVESP